MAKFSGDREMRSAAIDVGGVDQLHAGRRATSGEDAMKHAPILLSAPREIDPASRSRAAGTAGAPAILQRSDDDFVDATLEDLRSGAGRDGLAASLATTRADGVLKLFQPVQRQFHLALLEAWCDAPGDAADRSGARRVGRHGAAPGPARRHGARRLDARGRPAARLGGASTPRPSATPATIRCRPTGSHARRSVRPRSRASSPPLRRECPARCSPST